MNTMGTNLRADILRNHANISEESARFVLEAVVEGKGLARTSLLQEGLSSVVRNYPYELNSWPVFISPQTRERFAECAVAIPLLIPRVVRAAFNLDAARVASYYGISMDLASIFVSALPHFDIASHLVTRTDAILTAEGIKSLEINSGSNVGGWQIQFLDDQYRRQDLVSSFIGSMAYCESRNTLREFYRHILDSCRAKFPSERRFTWLLLIEEEDFREGKYSGLRELLMCFAAQEGIDLEMVLMQSMAEAEVRDGYLWLGDRRVNSLMIGQFKVQLVPNLLEVLLQDHLVWPDNPICGVLSDKRNAALLYQLRNSPEFTSEECALIERYLPWSAPTSMARVVHAGREWDLKALLLAHRTEFVLKPGRGACGNDVLVGRFTAPEAWAVAVEAAMDSGNFVAQAFCEGIPFYAQGSDQGYSEMDFVWGIFSFGQRYGGVWVRMMPTASNNSGVVNSAKGAQESIVYEAAS